jgi:hypothetical protein
VSAEEALAWLEYYLERYKVEEDAHDRVSLSKSILNYAHELHAAEQAA